MRASAGLVSACRRAAIALTVCLAAGCAPELDWRELKSDAGRFAVLMPARFNYEARTLTGNPGVTMHLWSARAAEAAFGAGYADYPQATPLPIDRTAQDLVANIDGRITAARELRSGAGISGREFEAEGAVAGQPRVLRARLLSSGRRLYQLVVIAPKGRLADEELEMFFGSFKLLP